MEGIENPNRTHLWLISYTYMNLVHISSQMKINIYDETIQYIC